jgi:hypothetical protein
MRLKHLGLLFMVVLVVIAVVPIVVIRRPSMKRGLGIGPQVAGGSSNGAFGVNLAPGNATMALTTDSPPLDLQSEHYSLDPSVMSDEFMYHLQNMTRRIHKGWRYKGWRRFDSVDISHCEKELPECGLFLRLLPKEESAATAHAFRKCCVEHRILRDLMLWVTKRLEEANVTYFLSTGTALGAVRHHGVIIPWDTDVDIAVFPSEQDRIIQLFSRNGEHYFENDPFGKPMFWIHSSKNGRPSNGPHVEIFYDPVYTKYPDSLLPLRRCQMYQVYMWCPNEKQFNVWFPSGWSTYGYGHYHGDHRCTLYRNGQKIMTSKC